MQGGKAGNGQAEASLGLSGVSGRESDNNHSLLSDRDIMSCTTPEKVWKKISKKAATGLYFRLLQPQNKSGGLPGVKTKAVYCESTIPGKN